MAYNPESNPLWPVLERRSRQGTSKELAVTVWFFWWNSNVIVSPTWAVMLGGLNASTPVPPTMILWSWLVGTVVEVDVAEVDVAVALAELEAVPPVAAAWKAARLSPGLIAKTMPCRQWFPCRQYAQIAVVRVTVSSATGKLLVTVSATGTLKLKVWDFLKSLAPWTNPYNPVSNPDASGVHGLSNVDCVTVWFFCWKINRTTSPIFASCNLIRSLHASKIQHMIHTTDCGLNLRTPGPPTVTLMVAHKEEWIEASRKT